MKFTDVASEKKRLFSIAAQLAPELWYHLRTKTILTWTRPSLVLGLHKDCPPLDPSSFLSLNLLARPRGSYHHPRSQRILPQSSFPTYHHEVRHWGRPCRAPEDPFLVPDSQTRGNDRQRPGWVLSGAMTRENPCRI